MKYTNGWLEYSRLSDKSGLEAVLCYDNEGIIIHSAVEELKCGFAGIYGLSLRVVTEKELFDQAQSGIYFKLDSSLPYEKEEYCITCNNGKCIIEASSEEGILYGAFSLLRNLQVEQVLDFIQWSYKERVKPSNALRMLNHWDNMDGSIERGYSGNSFFFSEEEILINDRTKTYARMVSSVGINAVVINNVNVKGAATELISNRYYKKVKELAELFSSYGIKLYLSVNFAAPIELGGLTTSDPLAEEVCNWWKLKAEEIWKMVPLLGGFLIKADSEGRPGPFTYGRTHADGANMLAKALQPFGGVVIWRCFVYNCKQDWRDTKTDRAKAGYDNFMPIDGMFAENVVLQIKNGPMDFQVREPISPLFGGLKKTNMILEVQIAQEYTGQQRHVCYLIPWFKEILNFNTYCQKEQSKVKDIISGRTYHNTLCGMTAVTNTGDDVNWTGHDLAGANLYGFGRLSFNMELSAETIAREWITLVYGNSGKVTENVLKILQSSWTAYEKYTSPLGIGWMVKPNVHYGPDVDGYEYDRWGTYHRADHLGIGVDRTEKGTGYCSQYNEPLASLYENIKTCPEDLLLFFHHVSYDYILSTGKTVIQHIYDTHFEGAMEAEEFLNWWRELDGLIERSAYERTLERFEHQAEHAREWRDVINSYFYRKSGINDQQGRELY